MSEKFAPTKEFPRQEKAPHEWPPQQGQEYPLGQPKDRSLFKQRYKALNRYVRKTADESVTSSTTLQDDDELFLGCPPGLYTVDLLVKFTSTSGASAAKYRTEWSGSGTMVVQNVDVVSTGGTAQNTDAAYTLNEVMTITLSTTTYTVVWIRAGLKATTSGILKFRWAQGTSNANALVCKAGSFMVVRKMAG
jgi:hypothetical protein